MNKKEFLELLENAKEDENGNLYIDHYYEWKNGTKEFAYRQYFGIIHTLCDDFATQYCSDIVAHCNRYYIGDYTLEIHIVKESK